MKILFVNKYFWLKGGAETVFFQDREAALEQGYDVIDFSMYHPENIQSKQSDFFVPQLDYDSEHVSKSNRLDQIGAAIKFIRNGQAVSLLKDLIKHEKPDIAHLHNIYHQITPAIIPVLKNNGVKVVMTLHDYKLVCPAYLLYTNNQICDRCLGGHFYNATLQKCPDGSRMKGLLLSIEAYWHQWLKSYEAVDIFISPSRYLAELVNKNRKGLQKVKVIHNGIDVNSYTCSFQDKGYIIYFGRISQEKGVETLIRAYSIMAEKLKEKKETVPGLKIVGDGPLLNDLKNKYPEIEFLGYKSGKDLEKLVSDSSFAVVPSEWYENCSMTVLEAMAYGKAVVGSRTGGIPEQIEDGKNGLLFELGNYEQLAEKMMSLIRNPDLRLKMCSYSREKVEKDYSLTKHKHELLKTYAELLSA